MNAEQASGVVFYLSSAYNQEVSKETAAVWVEHLRGVDVEVGREAARQWVAMSADRFMPNASQFLGACRTTAKRMIREGRLRPPSALPEGGATGGVVAREQALDYLAEIRRSLVHALPRVAFSARVTDPRDVDEDYQRWRQYVGACPYEHTADGKCLGDAAARAADPEGESS